MAANFDRFHPFMDRSFSLRTFNRYETEINEHFWSFKVVSEYSRFIAQKEKSADPDMPTAIVFKATGPDAGRIPTTVSDWLKAREQLENWLRLSALVSASSYLEIYIRQIVRSALMADPMCRFGANRSLDGTALLKLGRELPYEYEARSVTSGDWNARLAALETLFGKKPVGLDQHLRALEQVREIRNAYAHGFGRDLDIPMPSSSDSRQSRKLTQKTFLKYLGSVSQAATIIDRYLLNEIIGNFELIHFFHQWRERPRDPRDAGYGQVRAFQRALNRDQGVAPNGDFCAALIAYYDAA